VRPESFDEDVWTDWSTWVLDHGLPDLPAALDVGESVPVARWVGERFAAVLHVQWMWGDCGDDHLINEVETFARRDDVWIAANGSGGTGWFDPPFRRPESIGPDDVEVTGEQLSGGDGWYCCAVDGIAGTDARFIEVDDADGTTRQPIESPFGAFIACSDGTREAIVRVLDADDHVLLERVFGGDA
jgi:hypothetical protein